MKNNNQIKVRYAWHLCGQAYFDQPNIDPNLPWAVFPFDRASRQLVRTLTHAPLINGEDVNRPCVPVTVSFGDGPGARSQSGVLRLWSRATQGRRAQVRIGQPTDSADQIRAQFYQGLAGAREGFEAICASVLDLPELNDLGPGERKQARKILKTLAARPSHSITRLGDGVLGWFWTRFYTDVQLSGLNDARAELRDATPVYLSTHRSHLDYLLLSWVLYRAGLAIPLVAAGINLNLPLVGGLLRRGGAFFIRRSFKGDPLYPRIVAGYIKSRLKKRQPLEFFPEGGRSRDGQTRALKLGLLKYVVEAAQDPSLPPVALIPVSVAYDRMPDSGGYRYELEGRDKRGEGLSDLPKAWRALRSDPLGRVAVSFSNPIRLDTAMALADVGQQITDAWQQDMPCTAAGLIGLVVPGFTGHRAMDVEIQRCLSVIGQAAGLHIAHDCIQQTQTLGYLSRTDNDPHIWHAPMQARDQLSYAAGALKHRTLALGLLATAALGNASTRRTQALFELAWPTMAPPLYLPEQFQSALDVAKRALSDHNLSVAKTNADYRILAALAEPVVPELTRMLCTLRIQLEHPDLALDKRLFSARDKARQAMLLSGRTELGVLDIQGYRRFWDHLIEQGWVVEDQLTRRAKRRAQRLLDGFIQLDRQFLV